MLYQKFIKRNAAKLYLYGVVILALVVLTPAFARAGTIVFDPAVAAVSLQPGEQATLSFSAALTDPGSSRSTVSFSLALSSDMIDPAWVTTGGPVSLSVSQPASEIVMTVAVPAETPAGLYSGTFAPAISRTTEHMESSGLELQIEVPAVQACAEPPVIKNVKTRDRFVRRHRNKPLEFTFTGQVKSADNCTTGKAWYKLTDEYGEFSKTEPLVLDEDGRFKAPVKVKASRKGKDKDGRLYEVVFGAENEAGMSLSETQKIIISHDNRRENRRK